jgi:hypothetical protein
VETAEAQRTLRRLPVVMAVEVRSLHDCLFQKEEIARYYSDIVRIERKGG